MSARRVGRTRRLRDAWARALKGARAGRRRPADEGYTLTELAVALTLFGVLMAMTAPIVSTLFSTTSYVTSSYQNENQLLPISTTFQNLIRSVVEPAPNLSSGQPVPAYGVYNSSGAAVTEPSATSMTFFTNIGDPNGPAEVVASFSGSTFTVTVARANAGTCPGLNAGGTACTWGTARPLITVDNVVGAGSSALFTYSVGGTPIAPTNDATEFATCTASSCPAADIESVKVDLQVNVSPNQAGQAQEETVVYQLSALSQQYQPEVG
jgi:prepilin-type N-terminal cleavage/methylation domain-containing protein